MPNFAYLIKYVADVTKSIQFYEQVFGFKRKFVTPENDYGELDTGDTTISIASYELITANLKKGFQKSDPANVPFGIEIGITTDNVQELIDKCVLFGGIVYQEASLKPWGQTVGYVRDSDGFLIEICTPINA